MNTTTTISLVWTVLNSPAGITALAGLLLWALNRLFANRPAWQQYEGAIISAVKFAEKQIPDGSPNTGLARLDAALQLVLKVYAETNRQPATPQVAAQLKEGIQIVHDQLEARGTL